MLPFYENASEFTETATVGSFADANVQNSFDAIYEKTYNDFINGTIDIRTDIGNMVKNPTIMSKFKDSLLSGIMQECAERASSSED